MKATLKVLDHLLHLLGAEVGDTSEGQVRPCSSAES